MEKEQVIVGATKLSKGDLYIGQEWLIEAKTCMEPKKSFSIKKEWLTKMLDRASEICDVTIIDRNQGYNEEFFVSHSLKRYDKSKIAWRIYKPNNMHHEKRLDD